MRARWAGSRRWICCARSRGKLQVVIADRDVSAVRGMPVETAYVDVSDPGSLRRASSTARMRPSPRSRIDINLAAMHGALDAGAHYIDLGGLFHVTRRQLELGDEFESAG